MKVTQNKGITAAEYYGGKQNEGVRGDMSNVKGVPKYQGVHNQRGGVPVAGTAKIRQAMKEESKPKCAFGEDFGVDPCGAYPSKGTPYCYGHLRKLGDIELDKE
jgi:hypothetical protein